MKPTYEELERRVAELEERKRLLESAINQSTVAVLITDPQGVVEFVNENYFYLLGYSPEEMTDEFIYSILLGDESVAQYEEMKKSIMNGTLWRGDFNEKRKDGQEVWLNHLVFPVHIDGEIKHYALIIRDITQQKADSELKFKQDALQKSLLENIPLAIAIYDGTGKFLYNNSNTEKFFGLDTGSMTGKTFHEIFPKETADQQVMAMSKAFSSKKPFSVDRNIDWHGKPLNFKARHQPLLNKKGEVTSVLVIGENVTEQVRQAKLLQIQHQIDSLSNLTASLASSLKKAFHYLLEIDWVDSGGIYLFDEDQKNLRLVYSTGLSESYLKHVSVFASSDPPSLAVLKGKSRHAQTRTFLEPIKNIMLREKLTFVASIPLIYKKQVIGSMNLGSRSVENISQNDSIIIESIAARLANLIVLVKTREELLSSNLQLNQSLKELEDQQHFLIHKSQLESLGELSAGLAHEINQPLSVISLVMENIRYKHEQNTANKEYLTSKFEIINQNVNRVRQLIDHVRIFSRDHGKVIFERIEINNVIHNALSMIQSLLRDRNIILNLNLSPKVLYTIGNPSRFEQVILNLLTNSKDALGEKERLLGPESYAKEISIASSVIKDKVVISVKDNGSGISKANLEKLFIPFFTTKTDGMGTGLGLAIVYGILREMEGDIIASSEEGKFTEMRITLPHYKKIVEKK